MARVDYRVTSPEQVITDPSRIRREYESIGVVAIDLETTGLSSSRDKIALVSLMSPTKPPAVLRIFDGRLPPWLVDLLSRCTTIIGHNLAAFDLPFLLHAGVRLSTRTRYIDTLVLEALCLTSGRRDLRKDLATTLERRLDVKIDKSIDHAGWLNDDLSDRQILYAANDVAYLLPLFDAQAKKLRELDLLEAMELEISLVPVTATLVYRGLPFRVAELSAAIQKRRRFVDSVQREFFENYGVSNIRSAPQIKDLFRRYFDFDLKSTDADTLTIIASSYGRMAEVAREIEIVRRYAKSTMYDDRWVESYVDPDGRVRARYWQLGTDTGRYSSTKPNLQQFPRSLRYVVGYDDGVDRRLIAVDYHQIEVVIAAILFKDVDLIRALSANDVHMFTASILFDLPPSLISPMQRQVAKAATFTALFAGGVEGVRRAALMFGVNLSHDRAAEVLSRWYKTFPTVKSKIDNLRRKLTTFRAKNLPYKVTILNGGPIRYLIDDKITPSTVINTIVQGTAAVGLKRSMRRLWERFGMDLVATVHDEVVLDVPFERADETAVEAAQIMQHEMSRILNFNVKVKFRVSRTWGDAPLEENL